MNLASMLLAAMIVPGDVPAAPGRAEITSAVDKGLRRLEEGASKYPKHRNCFSCHHQALPVLALSAARLRGFKVTDEQINKHIDFALKSFTKHEAMIKGQSIGGANTTVAYALAMFAAVDYTADASTDALVQFLLARQRSDGAWPAVTKRPPSEGSAFTNAALTFLTLPKYGRSPGLSEVQRERVDKSLAAGKEWLLKNSPENHEDKVFRLRALVHAGVDAGRIATARDELLGEQRSDGSWGQLPDLAGDAYATGTALVALRVSGIELTHEAVRKGTKYLLATQKDGAWLVETRSRPIQTFFDNGDPGGKSQFISMYATGWAVLALLEHLPVVSAKH